VNKCRDISVGATATDPELAEVVVAEGSEQRRAGVASSSILLLLLLSHTCRGGQHAQPNHRVGIATADLIADHELVVVRQQQLRSTCVPDGVGDGRGGGGGGGGGGWAPAAVRRPPQQQRLSAEAHPARHQPHTLVAGHAWACCTQAMAQLTAAAEAPGPELAPPTAARARAMAAAARAMAAFHDGRRVLGPAGHRQHSPAGQPSHLPRSSHVQAVAMTQLAIRAAPPEVMLHWEGARTGHRAQGTGHRAQGS
jgi:hypothetical protein